jgi:hypothetical protein
MLCVKLKKYTRPCLGVSGGIGKIWVFDPADVDFTQAAPSAGGSPQPYTAVALRPTATIATGSGFFPITFQYKEAERTWKHSVKGCSTKYEHEFKAQLPQLSQELTAFLQSLDSAGCCCGLGLAIQHNDGKIFIAGEKYVNAAEIPPFIVQMNGSDGATGKLFDDFNGANVVFKADYNRDLYEFTGGAAAIAALEATA